MVVINNRQQWLKYSCNIVGAGFLLFSTLCHAAALRCLPVTAADYTFHQSTIVLSTTATPPTQRYYLLTNKSTSPFWLDIAVHPGSASAGWASLLHPGHSSILAMDKVTTAFSCTTAGKKQNKQVSCQTVLDVCQLQTPFHLEGKAPTTGSFWLKEDIRTPL
jgi:hypothetical protein